MLPNGEQLFPLKDLCNEGSFIKGNLTVTSFVNILSVTPQERMFPQEGSPSGVPIMDPSFEGLSRELNNGNKYTDVYLNKRSTFEVAE